jgi:hypothetical protein
VVTLEETEFEQIIACCAIIRRMNESMWLHSRSVLRSETINWYLIQQQYVFLKPSLAKDEWKALLHNVIIPKIISWIEKGGLLPKIIQNGLQGNVVVCRCPNTTVHLRENCHDGGSSIR